MKNKFLILLISLSVGIISCDLGNDPDDGGTATEALAGEYFVEVYTEPGGELEADYTQWTISNTAANTSDRIRITDNDNIFGFSSEANCDVNALTFWSDSTSNDFFAGAPADEPDGTPVLPIDSFAVATSGTYYYMKITGGQIFPGAAHVPSGTNADSIAFFITAALYGKKYNVVGYREDTINTDPLEIQTVNVYEFAKDTLVEDGPYFITGYRRTGFLEDEH
jgi:hypothetical protein